MLKINNSTDEFSHFPKLCMLGNLISQFFYFIVLTVEKPTRYEVLRQLVDVDASWRNIGDGLRVKDNYLQGLADGNMQNQTRLGHVIQKWLDMDGQDECAPVTWKTILDVVNGPLVNKKAQAMQICEHLKPNSSIQQNNQSKYGIVP